MARSTAGTGAAGAYLVAAELSLRGWAAAVTVGNAPRTDLLAQVGERNLPAAIQVKTKSERSKDFHLGGVQDPSADGANEWVILVGLSATDDHDYFIVPRNHAWATVQATMPGNSRGLIGPQAFPRYRGWDLLKRPSWEAEWMIQGWVRDSWEQLPWPAGQEPRRR